MARKMLVNCNCPLCGKQVEEVPDAVLKKSPHFHNAEIVVTKRGLKQYIHSSCWYSMIENRQPYNGKAYVMPKE